MKQLVLVGGGHAHLFVLKYLIEHKPQPFSVTLITPSNLVDYSGMLPGWVAGYYNERQCQIDLLPLTKRARVNFIADRACGLDSRAKKVILLNGTTVSYDVLSLDTGSESKSDNLRLLGSKLLCLRPLEQFRRSWTQALKHLSGSLNAKVAVVGGGAGGVELAFAINRALQNSSGDYSPDKNQSENRVASRASVPIHSRVCLIAGELLAGHAPGVGSRVLAQLQVAGIEVHYARAQAQNDDSLVLNDMVLPVDLVIAATGPKAAGWINASGLAVDEAGFILVDEFHRSVSHDSIFAAGDVCSRVDIQLAKSGVHAVRCGPILAQNLVVSTILEANSAQLLTSLKPYKPKTRSLYLLSCSNGVAIASWGHFSVSGRWVWRLKDYIDRHFIRSFSIF